MPGVKKVAGTSGWTNQLTKILLKTQAGLTVEAIARELHCNETTVVNARKRPDFGQRLDSLNNRLVARTIEKRATSLVSLTQEARDILTKAAPEAANKMVVLSKTGTKEDKVQFDAAKDILDRAGLKPVEVIEARERIYSPAEIAKAQGTLLETEAIIMRLKTRSSPFIIRDSLASKETGPASSDTGKSSDVQDADATTPS